MMNKMVYGSSTRADDANDNVKALALGVRDLAIF
jgi:hypothetical protein